MLVTIAIPAGAFMWLEGHTVMVFANYSNIIDQKFCGNHFKVIDAVYFVVVSLTTVGIAIQIPI